MNFKIAIAEDNSFLARAVIEKLSFFNDLNFKFNGVNGAELIGKLETNHNIDVIFRKKKSNFLLTLLLDSNFLID